MKLLLKCFPEVSAHVRNTFYAVLTLNSADAIMMLERIKKFKRSKRVDPWLSEMRWRWDLQIECFGPPAVWPTPAFHHKDYIPMPVDVDIPKGSHRWTPQTVNFEIWPNEDMVVSGVVFGSDEQRFHTGFLPQGLIAEYVAVEMAKVV